MRYQFDEFILDTESGELLSDGAPVILRRQAFRLLQLLLERAPALLSRDTLLDEIWGRSALAPNALPQAISELRLALGDDAASPRFIQTRHRRGYRFVAEVRQLPQPGTSPRTANADTGRPARSGLRYALLAGVLLAAAGLATLWMQREPQPLSNTISNAGRIRLALAPLPAAPDVPTWVSSASTEMLAQYLFDSRLQLIRGDALRMDPLATGSRWQHQAHELLGADTAVTGHGSLGEGDKLSLDLSVIHLGNGHVLASRHLSAKTQQLDELVRRAGTIIASALHLPPPTATGAPDTLTGEDGRDYAAAMTALAADRAQQAASLLGSLHTRLGQPRWLEPVLLTALTRADQRNAALRIIRARLENPGTLALGERLRLQAQAARLSRRPADAAAALRALTDLYPDDIDSRIALVHSELDALQGEAARRTLARLESMPLARQDPRLSVVRSRIARIDGNPEQAARDAAAAARIARKYKLPELALTAAREQANARHASGQLTKAVQIIEQASDEWGKEARPGSLLALQIERARLLRELGQVQQAESALALLQNQARHQSERTRIAIETALTRLVRQDAASAQALLDEVQANIESDAADPDLHIAWLDARALVAAARHQGEQANALFTQAFALARSHHREGQHVALQVNAGLVLARQKRFAEAEQHWQQALETFALLGDRRGQATCLGNLAAAASSQGQTTRSVELNTRALELFRQLHLPGPRARTAYNLALAASRAGRLTQAADYFAEAGLAWRDSGQHDLALRAGTGQAETMLAAGKPAAAGEVLDSLHQSRDNAPLSRSHVLAARAHVSMAQGQLENARALLQESRELRQRDGHPGWVALSELELLRVDLLTGANPVQVQVASRNLAQRFETMGETRDAARAWLLVAEAQLSRGENRQARQTLERVERFNKRFADQTLSFDLEWVRA